MNLNAIYKNSSDAFFRVNENGCILENNPGARRMFEYDDEELKNNSLEEKLFSKDSGVGACLKRAFKGEMVQNTPVARKGGYSQDFHGLMSIFLEDAEQETPHRRAWVFVRDVSRAARDEKKLELALLERETLLKEIHHRVKNNLQIISSILELYNAHGKDRNVHEALRECRARIQAMSLVHQSLYQSSHSSKLDLSEYLRSVGMDSFFTCTGSDSFHEIKFDMDSVLVNIETALPCGLLLTELVSNSIKHAFGEKKGLIKVSLKLQKEGVMELAYSDNGKGLAQELDLLDNPKTLGLRLVRILCKQIDAKVDLPKIAGFAFNLKFSEMNYKERYDH